MDNVIIPNKQYFKIGEVSSLTQLETYVLRYWETEFKSIRPVRMGSNQRLYRRKDVETILEIKKLLYEEGYTIAGARKKLGMDDSPASPASARPEDEPVPESLALMEMTEDVRTSLNEILSIMADTDRRLKKP